MEQVLTEKILIDNGTLEELPQEAVFIHVRFSFNPPGQGFPPTTGPRVQGLPSEYMGKDGVMVRYVDPENPGKPIQMLEGRLVVPRNKPALYKFLTEMDFNRDNPKRNQNKPALFYEQDPIHKRRAKAKHDVEVAKATAVIVGMDSADRRVWAEKLQVRHEGVGDDDLINMLVSRARQNPSIFLEEGNVDDRMKTLVLKAIEKGVITFAGPQRSWYWDKSFNDKNRMILESAKGKKDVDEIVSFFLSDQPSLDLLNERLDAA